MLVIIVYVLGLVGSVMKWKVFMELCKLVVEKGISWVCVEVVNVNG